MTSKVGNEHEADIKVATWKPERPFSCVVSARPGRGIALQLRAPLLHESSLRKSPL